MKIKVSSRVFDFDGVSSVMKHASKYDENHHCLETITDGPLGNLVKTTYTYDGDKLVDSSTFIFNNEDDGKAKMRASAQPSVGTAFEYDDKGRVIHIRYYGDHTEDENYTLEDLIDYKNSKYGVIITTTSKRKNGDTIIHRAYDETSETPRDIEYIEYDKDMNVRYYSIDNKIFPVEGSENIVAKSYRYDANHPENTTMTIGTYEYDPISKKHWIISMITTRFNNDTFTVTDDVKLIIPDNSTTIESVIYNYINNPKVGYLISGYITIYTDETNEKHKAVCKYHYDHDDDGNAKLKQIDITDNVGSKKSKTNQLLRYKNDGKFVVIKDNRIGSTIVVDSIRYIFDEYSLESMYHHYDKEFSTFYDVTDSFPAINTIYNKNIGSKDHEFRYRVKGYEYDVSYRTKNNSYGIKSQMVKDQNGNPIYLTQLKIGKYKNGDKLQDDTYIINGDARVVLDVVNYLLTLAKVKDTIEEGEKILNAMTKKK